MQEAKNISSERETLITKIGKYWFSVLAWTCIAVYSADWIYRSIYGITYETRQNCVLYRNVPKWFFMLYENVLELFMVVVIGVVIAALVEKYFKRISPVFPDNSITAFLYASVLPVCSCTSIPLIKAMHEKISYRTIITFLVSAPLLNPYIIMLTYRMLGLEYMIARIAASFAMAYSSGVLMEKLLDKPEVSFLSLQCVAKKNCSYREENIWNNARSIFIQIMPYIVLAGGLSLAFEFTSPAKMIELIPLDNGIFSTLLMVALGIPIYLCNGADTLVLKPLAQYTDIGFGTAMSFSLTSSAICISSFVLLMKFIGIKHTVFLTALIFISAVAIGTLLNNLSALGF
ncbi:permease [Gemmatimonadota bacterium]